ncbi:MAG: FHA domain-containing protein [Candidatus Saccharibacteria bacterium]|nr:FHA domain-containing protein [Candidatus Saccharibacteria bacterium]
MIVSSQQAEEGVKLVLGGEDGSIFRVCPVKMLPKDSEGYPLLGNVRINPNRLFVLLDDSSNPSEDGTGIKGLKVGEGITLGRQGPLVEERFPNSSIREDKGVSRSHLDILVGEDGSISIVDHSTNGTWVDVVAKVDEGPANPWESLAQWPEAPKAAPGEFIDSTPWSASVALSEAPPKNEVVGTQVYEAAASGASLDEMTEGLTENDKNVLARIAFEAREKREAQQSGDGERSRSCSRQIGALLNGAQNKKRVNDVMRRYASVVYGNDNVAF